MTFSKTWSNINRVFLVGALLASFSIQFKQAHAQNPQTPIGNDRFMSVERHVNDRTQKIPEQASNNEQVSESVSARPTTSEIWSALLLGNSRQRVSKPRFAFSPRRNAYDYYRTFPSNAQTRQNLENNRLISQTLQHAPQYAYSVPRRQSPALEKEELQTNELLFKQDDESISATTPNAESEKSALEIEQRIEELNQYLAVNRPPAEDLQLPQLKDEEPATPKEFPKRYPIRQTAGETPKFLNGKTKSSLFEEKLPSRNNGVVTGLPNIRSNRQTTPVVDLASEKTAPESLPVRPNALQISERSFISTEIVRLPASGNISFPSKKTTTQKTSTRNTTGAELQPSEGEPTFVQPDETVVNSISDGTKDSARQRNAETNANVLRPKGKFINPRDL